MPRICTEGAEPMRDSARRGWRRAVASERLGPRVAAIALWGFWTPQAKLPAYMQLWAHSCHQQRAWLSCFLIAVHDGELLSGVNETQVLPQECPQMSAFPASVRIVALSFAEIAAVTEIAGVRVDLNASMPPRMKGDRVRKTADLKPLSGYLAHAAVGLDGFSHWALTEPDLMIGAKMRDYIEDNSSAIVSFFHHDSLRPPAVSGQFVLHPNTEVTRTLWARAHPQALRMLRLPIYKVFDEVGYATAVFRKERHGLPVRSVIDSTSDDGMQGPPFKTQMPTLKKEMFRRAFYRGDGVVCVGSTCPFREDTRMQAVFSIDVAAKGNRGLDGERCYIENAFLNIRFSSRHLNPRARPANADFGEYPDLGTRCHRIEAYVRARPGRAGWDLGCVASTGIEWATSGEFALNNLFA